MYFKTALNTAVGENKKENCTRPEKDSKVDASFAVKNDTWPEIVTKEKATARAQSQT